LTPLLLLLLLGTIDLGRMYADYVDLKHAARDGAGYGIVAPTDYTGMQNRVLAAGVPPARRGRRPAPAAARRSAARAWWR